MKRRIAVLLGLILAACALGTPTASAEKKKRPDFQAPFKCGSKWTYSSYPGHGNVLDFIRADGGESKGQPVLAAADGTAHLRNQPGGAGLYVEIDHGNGWKSEYFHLQKQLAKDGAKVKQGARIGLLGSTGSSTGPHLHHEQKLNGEQQDVTFDGRSLKPYPSEYGQKNLTSKNCDGGDPGDPGDPPKAKKTTLKYTGDTSISNGSKAELSAALKDDSHKPVAKRKVTFSLGSGDHAQKCTGTTDSEGTATCPVKSVNQPLTEKTTVPVTAAFKGDDGYKASKDSAQLKQQYVSGRAYGLSAEVPVLALPLSIDPTPDTGTVRTAKAETKSPACTQQVDALALSAKALCSKVRTDVGPSRSKATSTVAETSVGLPGLPVVELSAVRAVSSSTCTSARGDVDAELSIAGTPVSVPHTPNFGIDLGSGAKLVVNEQKRASTADHGLTVNAAHLTAPGGVDLVIGSSTSSAHNCA